MTSSLPIDNLLPQVRQALADHPALILQAPPGSGKTTRVPLALLDEPWLAGRKILMLEPRRLAASNAACYMAGQLGEPVGRSVGYRIRYRQQVSRQTRIEVVTEGILTRRLQSDPELHGVGLVIFDEFHERHLTSDLALALCRDAQLGLREDLRLLVMSATLAGEALAGLLQAPLLRCEGRSYPVTLHYLPQPDRRRIADACAAAVRKVLDTTSGDLLVFMPGAGEIRDCRRQLAELPDIDIRPLYGELGFADQERAILPGARRKVVLATNLAETSLTIEGIQVVIDSGLARQPQYDPGSGITRLETRRISAASATQRAGRAGRLGPGQCFRLWDAGTQGSLLPFTPPEIRNADLAPLALELAAWGIDNPDALCWLDPPPVGQLQTGRELLLSLGALDTHRRLTPLGRRMAELPTHPRLARLLLDAKARNCLPLACDLIALLGERDPWWRREQPAPSRCDLLDRLEEFWRQRSAGIAEAFAPIERASRYWRDLCQIGTELSDGFPPGRDQIGTLLAGAFPDRIARRRQEGSRDYLLSSGKGARLAACSALPVVDLLVAVDLRQGRNGLEISLASAIDRETLLAVYPDLTWQRRVTWDKAAGRVVATDQKYLGALPIAERPARPTADELASALLDGIRQEGLEVLNWSPAAVALRNRIGCLRRYHSTETWPDLSDPWLKEHLECWLLPYLAGRRSRSDLKQLDLLPALRGLLDWRQQRQLDELAPERLVVPSGSSIRLTYPEQGVPVLAVKLQELFGLAETPSIAAGKLAIQLQLLSPARRPLQITQDLRHFWDHVYPEVRKEMQGRYPRHPWPEDPWSTPATGQTKRQS